MIKMLACTQANREKAMKAAGTLAVGLAAGVVMSALAIDLTDATVAGAILAAGTNICCNYNLNPEVNLTLLPNPHSFPSP
jgi:hypothetical protein